MFHRYGRHGPRAWLRRRKRRDRPSMLPTIVQPVQPETRVIRVHIPSGISAERIILIIMQNNGDSEIRPNDQQVVDGQAIQLYSTSLPDTEHRMPALFSADNELKENAKIEANKDLRVFTRARDYGKGVSIDRKALVARAEDLADKDLENYRSRHGNITATEYARLFEVYKNTYMAEISETINRDSEVIGWLENPRDAELRAQAIKDRDTVRPIGSDHRLSHHRRDLGVLRVMIVYNIDLDQALGDLETLHRLIDKYEDYQRKSGNEVIWPAPATFQ